MLLVKFHTAFRYFPLKNQGISIFNLCPSIMFGIEIRRSPVQVPFANELESDEELLAPEEAEAPISPVTAAITRHA